ncbi:MAG: penicillin-binding protein activator [Chromatiales bacterium]|nr:penicillin-binding protein activator [Chromatiales bacterium]
MEALIKAGQVREARDKLRGIDVTRLDPSLTARRRMLEAQLAVLEEKPEDAQRLLAQAEKIPNLDPSLTAEIYRVRAETEVALGRPMNAVKARITRERYLVAADEITRNQQDLWQLLDTLSRTQMQQELTTTRDPVLAGWLQLAIIGLENAGSRVRPGRRGRVVAAGTRHPPGHAGVSQVARQTGRRARRADRPHRTAVAAHLRLRTGRQRGSRRLHGDARHRPEPGQAGGHRGRRRRRPGTGRDRLPDGRGPGARS